MPVRARRRNLGVSYGPARTNGLVSVEYMFKGESAHAAGAPWRGRSALDAVELMDVGWNFRREHLRLAQRVALRHHQRRRPAQRRAAQCKRLVLLPRGRLRAHHEYVAHRRQHGQGRHADDRYHLYFAPAGQRLARLLQQTDRGSDVREHQEGRTAAVVGRRPDAGEGATDGAESSGAWSADKGPRVAAAAQYRRPAAGKRG